MDHRNEDLSELLGKTMLSVTQHGNEAIRFTADTGEQWEMSGVYTREPDCCASCYIEDVFGYLQDLVGRPVWMAEVGLSRDNPKAYYPDESFTWTFYKFATSKGYVTVRWYGSSSETASFRKVLHA